MSDRNGTKTPLNHSAPEYGYLEYALQLSLHSSTARISTCHSVSNPHLQVQFDRKCKDVMQQNCWLDASILTGVNTEEEVIRRGFQFTPGQVHGLKIPIGSLRRNLRGMKGGKVVRKLLFCKIGLGRSFVCDEASVETKPLPDGYDSFYIQEGGLKEDPEYYQEYFVKNSQQILPLYLVQYEFDNSKEKKSRELPNCDNCEEEVLATVYCAADKAHLCNKCDTKLHEPKVASRHVRTPIGKGAEIFGHCRHHQEEWIKYYCSQCHIPVCVVCKMVGNHSNGDCAKHQLVSVTDAYNVVLQEAQAVDPVLQGRRTEITNQISAVNSRAKAVEKMGHLVQTQIDEIYRRATEDLRILIQRKMDVLLGDQIELKRQIMEYDRLEDFVKYQQAGDPTQFLFSWSKQQKVRQELHDFKFFRDEIDVNLDIKVTGGVVVSIDHDPIPNSQTNNNYSIQNSTSQSCPSGAIKTITPTMQNMNQQIQISNTSQGLIQKNAVSVNNIGLGIPRRSSERRVQRRTSDFFSETLGAFDQFNLDDD
ncbi:hypothetical protein HK099_004099 [Clydaea vesicula]|uniref:B box-type domain-containing protein n=1 Tax=Clydaea vesicula TaxID=447962 RepID=A0AAD5U3M4_9FUNG|nr:hypothetical protein HK099_004099 [Clydaea vesicula]KAJ3383674.1 hypothetical protein HDU92_004016 [Lobulomyces angularis]